MFLVHVALIAAALNIPGEFDHAPPGEVLQRVDFNVTGKTGGRYLRFVASIRGTMLLAVQQRAVSGGLARAILCRGRALRRVPLLALDRVANRLI